MLTGSPASCTRTAAACSYVAVVGAVIAGVFGGGGGEAPEPVRRQRPGHAERPGHQPLPGRGRPQIDPGVVALVQLGRRAQRRPRGSASTRSPRSCARSPTWRASSASTTRTTPRWSPATAARPTCSPTSSRCRTRGSKDDAQQIENRFAGQRRRQARRRAIANAQVNTQVSHDLAHAELLAFPFMFLLSLLFFRSLVAALLPPLLGGLAIVATFFALRIVASFVDLSVFALNLVTGLGLGLAIDYSLFMVSRYREEAADSGFGAEALRRTLQTAGRTIMFSSLTVAAAVASLAIFPQRFLYSMGIAGALVALLAAALALTVLPALLAVLGPRVNALAPKRLARAAERDARPAESGFWYRLSRFVMRRPALIAIASAAFLIALGIPFYRDQVHLGRRERAARQRERPPGQRRRSTAVPAEPHLAARGRRRRARPARRRSRRWRRGSRACRTSPRSSPAQPAGRLTSLMQRRPRPGAADRRNPAARARRPRDP